MFRLVLRCDSPSSLQMQAHKSWVGYFALGVAHYEVHQLPSVDRGYRSTKLPPRLCRCGYCDQPSPWSANEFYAEAWPRSPVSIDHCVSLACLDVHLHGDRSLTHS